MFAPLTMVIAMGCFQLHDHASQMKDLVGTWEQVGVQLGNSTLNLRSQDVGSTNLLEFRNDWSAFWIRDGKRFPDEEVLYILGAESDLKTIDMVKLDDKGVMKGIYRMENELLCLCFFLSEKPGRPEAFKSKGVGRSYFNRKK